MKYVSSRATALGRILAAIQASLLVVSLITMSLPAAAFAQETPSTDPAPASDPAPDAGTPTDPAPEVTTPPVDEATTDDSTTSDTSGEDQPEEASVQTFTTQEESSSVEEHPTDEELQAAEEAGEADLSPERGVEHFVSKPTLHIKKVLIQDNGATDATTTFSVTVTKHRIILPDQTFTASFDVNGDITSTIDPTVSFDLFGHHYAQYYTVEEASASGYTTTYDNCSDLEFGYGDSETCTVTNDDIAPPTPQSCSITSDTSDYYVEGDHNAVATFVHNAWATIADATWIWGDAHVQHPDQQEVQTFEKDFTVTGTPTEATLTIAADNGVTVKVNGTTVLTQDPNGTNYSPAATVVIDPSLLHTGANTLEFTVTNLAYGTDPEQNPAGLDYKLDLTGTDCSSDQHDSAGKITVVATKIVCTDEKDLPNYGLGGPNMTATTATDWVKDHASCHVQPDWEFQIGNESASDAGRAFIGAPDANYHYTTFGPTDANGVATTTFSLANATVAHLREILQPGYIPFTFDQQHQDNSDDVSAEFYCSDDVLNYDNWDFINNPQKGNTYYCVAWNAPVAQTCNPEASTVLTSGDGQTHDEDGLASIVSSIHSMWVQSVGQWIWKDSSTSAGDAADGTAETFTRTFTVVGTPTGASLDLAADNGIVVTVNGHEVINNPGEFNYTATTTTAIPAADLLSGSNTITFKVTNLLLNGGHDGTPDNNPAGLLYTLTVNNNECVTPPPTEDTSTVTMCKVKQDEGFTPLSGWTLMLKGDSVQQGLAIPVSDMNGVNSASLDAGTSYIASASGTWTNAGQGQNLVDAEYSTIDNWSTHMDGFTGYSPDILELQINSAFDADGNNWGPYNSNHTYARQFSVASDGPANFRIFDGNGTTPESSWYGDNVASNLSVDINKGYAGVTDENGCVTFDNVPYGTYTIAEDNQPGWSYEDVFNADGQENADGAIEALTAVIDSPTEKFTVMNSQESGECPAGQHLDDGECVADNNNGGDGTGTLTIVKHSIGGVDTFNFTVDGNDESSQTDSLTTTGEVDGTASDDMTLDPGTYTVNEDTKDGWTLQSTVCEETSDNNDLKTEVAIPDNQVTIADGGHVTCTFTNTKDSEQTSTEDLVTVAPSDMQGWAFFAEGADPNSVGEMVTGPTGSFNNGSAHFTLTTNTQGETLGNWDLAGTRFDKIASLAYETYTPDATVALPALQFDFDNDRTDADNSFKGRLVYEPYYTHTVTPNTWQTWNPMDNSTSGALGNWWFSNGTIAAASGCSIATPCTWAQILTKYPQGGIRNNGAFSGGVYFKLGSGGVETGNVDKFVMGITAGSNTNTTTYDFEPDAVTPVTPQSTEDGSGGKKRSASSQSDGEVLGASTECQPLITDFLGRGFANPMDEVMKLQGFLNENLGLSIPLTGIFGPMTADAVMEFQKKYWQDVLVPWFGFPDSGITSENTPTGIVYKTTQWKINDLFCPGSQTLPALP